MIIFDFPLFAAFIDVAISGRDVPIAIIVSPINESEIFKNFEILIAESTVISAPNRVIMTEIIAMGIPKIKGFLKDRLEKKLFSGDTSSISSALYF